MDCELLQDCAFFSDNLRTMPVTSGLIKERFCKGEFEKCARLMVAKALESEKVPETLYPIHLEEAQRLLNDAETDL